MYEKRNFFIMIFWATFTGLMMGLLVPGLGGLIYPPMEEKIGGPFVASSNDKIILEKYDYSYKPGQSGTYYVYYRVSPNGKKEDVTFKLIGYSILIYSIICVIICLIIGFIIYFKFYRKT